MNKMKLTAILELHIKWVRGDIGGEKANLYGAILSYADLRSANLSYADLRSADLRNANLTDTKLSAFKICPDEGSVIGYKKVGSLGAQIVLTLKIGKERTNSLVGRKCRAKAVKVLKAEMLVHGKLQPTPATVFFAKHDTSKYELGKVRIEKDYNPDIRVECTKGLHFFITKQEAIEYE